MDRKATKPQTDPTGKKKISKKMKIIYGAIIMLVVVSLLVFTIWWCHNKLFTENPRFVLRRIELNTMSNGYWKNRESSMWRRLGLKEGENIFSVDLKKTREKLLCISNLSNAEVEIVLPDTLKIDLTERVPRAFLGNESSPWVLDDKCILVPRSETIATRLDLPVIIGYRDKKKKHYYSGTELEDARAAMALIMTVEPGFGGQKFMSDMLPKIKAIREMAPSLDIQVDGGINESTASLCAEAGANVFVVGTASFRAPDMAQAIKNIRLSAEKGYKGE